MRALVFIGLYAGGVLAIGALVSYPVYLALTGLGAEALFHEVVIRTLKVTALLGLIPLMGALGLQRLRAWGYGEPRRRFLRHVLVGLGAGLAMALVLVLTLVALEVRVVKPNPEWNTVGLVALVLKACLAAMVVSAVEETWFRGALFTAIADNAGVWWGVVASAGLFGAVHFIRADTPIGAEALDWTSGLDVVGSSFRAFGDILIIDSLLALTAAGVLLALVRCQAGTIAHCIGIHAGWVIVVKVARKTTQVDRGADWSSLVGTYDGFTGYLAGGWFILLSAAYFWLCMRRRRPP